MTTPERDVLAAIDALERDEIGELVTWQLEEGRRRGDGPDNLMLAAPSPFIVAALPNLHESGFVTCSYIPRTASLRTGTATEFATAVIECNQDACDWKLPIEWRDPGGPSLGVVRLAPGEVEDQLREHCEGAHGIPVLAARADSSSSP